MIEYEAYVKNVNKSFPLKHMQIPIFDVQGRFWLLKSLSTWLNMYFCVICCGFFYCGLFVLKNKDIFKTKKILMQI